MNMTDKDLLVELIPISPLALALTRQAPTHFRAPNGKKGKIEHAMHTPSDKIQLRFSTPRKEQYGFSIGPSADCDIQISLPSNTSGPLPKWGFLFDTKGRLMICNLPLSPSEHMTAVSYNDRAKESRHKFAWLLNGLPARTGGWKIVAECRNWDILGYRERIGVAKFEPVAFEIRAAGHLLLPQSAQRVQQEFGLIKLNRIMGDIDSYVYLGLEQLGVGGEGIVQRVFDVSTGEQFAMKTSRYGRTKGLRQEMEMLLHLDHPNVIKMKRLTKPAPEGRPGGDRLLLEYAPYGSLHAAHRKRPFSLVEGWEIVRQCFKALEYLHSQKVMHRDIKPGNILVCSRRPVLVKMADFGFAKAQMEDNRSYCGTGFWMAPEVGTRLYSAKADVWSLGIMIRGIMHGNADMMYARGGFFANLQDLRNGLTGGFQSETCPLMTFLAKYMVVTDPNQRLSVEECKRMLFSSTAHICCKLHRPSASNALTDSICIEEEENAKATYTGGDTNGLSVSNIFGNPTSSIANSVFGNMTSCTVSSTSTAMFGEPGFGGNAAAASKRKASLGTPSGGQKRPKSHRA